MTIISPLAVHILSLGSMNKIMILSHNLCSLIYFAFIWCSSLKSEVKFNTFLCFEIPSDEVRASSIPEKTLWFLWPGSIAERFWSSSYTRFNLFHFPLARSINKTFSLRMAQRSKLYVADPERGGGDSKQQPLGWNPSCKACEN